MLFGFCLTGMKISRCVYAGEGLILLFSVLLMGFVKAAFCLLTYLIYMSTTSVWREIFGESNDIIFNQKKSASLYFLSKMLKGAHLPNVYLNGFLVKQVDSVMYLGHFVTCELSDDIGIRRQCRLLNVRSNILSRKFHMCSVPVKLKLFNSYCASLYTPHLWWNYKKMSVTKLHITYHNILKRNIGLSNMKALVQPVLIPTLNVVNLLFVILYSNLCVDSISLTMH